MKMTISEMKLKGEQDDKVKFTAKVKDVYKAKDVPLTEKNKYTVARQNVLVEDESDNIKVIISFKSKDDVFTKEIIGKEVGVDGGLSIWEGKMNIFGKLIFKEGEAPKPNITTKNQTITTGVLEALSPQRDMRDISLQRAMEFWTARIGDKMEEDKIIATAEVFYKYLAGSPTKISGQNKPKVTEEKKELTGAKTEGQIIKVDNIPLINEVMALKEEHNLTADQFESYCNGKDIKVMTTEELMELKKVLSEFTTDVPF